MVYMLYCNFSKFSRKENLLLLSLFIEKEIPSFVLHANFHFKILVQYIEWEKERFFFPAKYHDNTKILGSLEK